MKSNKLFKLYVMIIFMMSGGLFLNVLTVYAKPVLPTVNSYTVYTGGDDQEKELKKIKGLTENSVVTITVEASQGMEDAVGLLNRKGDDDSKIWNTLTIRYNKALYDLDKKTDTWELDDVFLVGQKEGTATICIEVDGETARYGVTIKHKDPKISLKNGMTKDEIKKELSKKWKSGKNARFVRTVIDDMNTMDLDISDVSKYTSITITSNKKGLKIAKVKDAYSKISFGKFTKVQYNVSDLDPYDDGVKFKVAASKSGIYKLTVKAVQDGKTVKKEYYVNAVKYSNPFKSLTFGNGKRNYAPYFKERIRLTDTYMSKSAVKATLGKKNGTGKAMRIRTNKNYTITRITYRKNNEWNDGTDGTKLNIYKTASNTWTTDKLPWDFWELYINYEYKENGKTKKGCAEIFYSGGVFMN